MADRLPPLTALRAFETAARHLSFAKTADELGVTEKGRVLQPDETAGFDALRKGWRPRFTIPQRRIRALTSVSPPC